MNNDFVYNVDGFTLYCMYITVILLEIKLRKKKHKCSLHHIDDGDVPSHVSVCI